MKNVLTLLLMVSLLSLVSLVGIAEEVILDEPLILGTTDRVTELSFANAYDMFTAHVFHMTTRGLVALTPLENQIVGDVAESWDITSDGLEYTFYLKPGITFWDGEPCNAAAVKWCFDRALRLDGPKGAVGLIKGIDHIDVIDDLTVKFTLKLPDATFLLRISNAAPAPSALHSPKVAPENDFARGVYAGLGPYKLVEYVPDQYVKYEAYDGYFGDAPKTRLVIEKFYSDASALRAAIEAGDVDIVYRTLAPQDVEDLKDNPDVVITYYPPSPGIRYLLFNVTTPPVDNVLVRQGITYLVDRDAIVAQVFDGTVDPIYTMVPNVDPPFFGALPTFPKRDVEKGKELLASVGYNESNPLKLNLWYSPKHYGTFEADVATVLKGSLEETGVIQINIQVLEWAAYSERMGEGGMEFFLLGWHPDYLDSSNFLAPWITESPQSQGTYFHLHPNYQAYVNIMDVALASTDRAVRTKMFEAFQILSTQDVPWIPMWSMTDEMVLATRTNVRGHFMDLTMECLDYLIYKVKE